MIGVTFVATPALGPLTHLIRSNVDNTEFNRDSSYALYMSQEHDCSYLPERMARTLFLDPSARVNQALYQYLIDRGFRRSGQYLYQPACSSCEACVSLRLPASDFSPNRSQRRNWKLNQERIVVSTQPAVFNQAHFDLYKSYQEARHVDGALATVDPEQYLQFLTCPWADTLFYEFHLDDQLVAVVVTDHLPEGLSAVYTFFDPVRKIDGLGVYALLWQIELARQLGKPWVYPGYWVEGSDKMDYKSAYRPLEAWNGKEWRRFTRNEPIKPHFGA
jgi:arginine-tRNA-protein transferase